MPSPYSEVGCNDTAEGLSPTERIPAPSQLTPDTGNPYMLVYQVHQEGTAYTSPAHFQITATITTIPASPTIPTPSPKHQRDPLLSWEIPYGKRICLSASPPSSSDTPPPSVFEVGESSGAATARPPTLDTLMARIIRHEEQLEEISNHLEVMPIERIEGIEDVVEEIQALSERLKECNNNIGPVLVETREKMNEIIACLEDHIEGIPNVESTLQIQDTHHDTQGRLMEIESRLTRLESAMTVALTQSWYLEGVVEFLRRTMESRANKAINRFARIEAQLREFEEWKATQKNQPGGSTL